jgi:hypothetical protein
MKKTSTSFILAPLLLLFCSEAFPQANTSLSNLTGTSVNQNLLPNANNSLNLGSTSKSWKNIYADGKIFLDDNIFIDNNGTRNTLLGATHITTMWGTDNTLIGDSAGLKNEDGSQNVFIGGKAGYMSQGDRNTYIGVGAGAFNGEFSPGDDNCMYGYASGANSGESNSANCFFGAYSGHGSYGGGNNSYFGFKAGYTNVSAPDNCFFGSFAGYGTSDQITGGGSGNSFVGDHAGYDNTTGYYNTFSGNYSGQGNTYGNQNTAIGTYTRFGSNNLVNATAIGSHAQVSSSNSIVLGGISGINGATADTKVGIGTNSPLYRLQVENYSNDVYSNYHYFRPGGASTHYGLYNYMSSLNTPTGILFGLYNAVNMPSANSNTGYGLYSAISGGSGGTHYGVYAYASGGSSNWAVYSSGDSYATGTWQSSDERLKRNIGDVKGALDQIMQLKARTYDFRTDEYEFMNLPKGKQYGFVAQELEDVFPEMVRDIQQPKTRTGETADGKSDTAKEDIFNFKGVNYQMLIPVLTEAIQEQQKQIEELKAALEALQAKEDLKNGEIVNKDNAQQASLSQNVPNPVSGYTVITSSLPSSVTIAEIRVTDITGKMLRTVSLSNNGNGQIDLDVSDFKAGNYYYSLWVNGSLVVTRQLTVMH